MALVRVVLGDFGVRERGRGAPHTHTLTSRSPLRALSQIPQTPAHAEFGRAPLPKHASAHYGAALPHRRDLEALSHPALVTASTVTHAAAAAGTMEMPLTQLLRGSKGLTGAGKAVVGAEHITAEEQMREAIRAHHQSPSLPRTR